MYTFVIYACKFSDLEDSTSDPVSKTTAIVNLKGAVDLLSLSSDVGNITEVLYSDSLCI